MAQACTHVSLSRPRGRRAWLATAMAAALASTPAAWAQPEPAQAARRLADLHYGPAPRQAVDVYLPPQPVAGAPVLFLVHGGAWRIGDKAHPPLLAHKLARWLPRGVILVSVNYRMLPVADPAEQARDVARALAFVQQQAPQWGGDPQRLVAMGHSAGAHLVALVTADPAWRQAAGARPVRAVVLLDSAGLDLPRLMQAPHPPLYDTAFGADPAVWQALSPLHRLAPGGAPVLAVCSTLRRVACDQAQRFAAQARGLGQRAEVLPQALTHGQINEDLGLPGAYTEAVEAFWRSVDPRAW